MTAGTETPARVATRSFKPAMAPGWWMRKSHYFWYMVREFTALPLALWLLWLIYEIRRAGHGASGYYPPSSTPFIVFSVICLLFALYHSITFLRLAGGILHFKVLDKPVPSWLVVTSQFAAWLVASIVIGAVLIGFGR